MENLSPSLLPVGRRPLALKKNVAQSWAVLFFRDPSLFNNSYNSALSNSTFEEETNHLELSDAKDVEKSGIYSAPFEIPLEIASHARKERQLVRTNLSALSHSLFALHAHFYPHPRHVRHLPAFAWKNILIMFSYIHEIHERTKQITLLKHLLHALRCSVTFAKLVGQPTPLRLLDSLPHHSSRLSRATRGLPYDVIIAGHMSICPTTSAHSSNIPSIREVKRCDINFLSRVLFAYFHVNYWTRKVVSL